jgi:DnaJ-class molecular chaperone
VEVKIPAGAKDGQTIRLRGQGVPGRRGGPAGDALITVQLALHPRFQRDGRDLRLELPITLQEAVLGGKVTVPTLSGPVALTVPANSNTGATLRLKGKGLPGQGGDPAGDLYVRLAVALPDARDPGLEAFAREWQVRYDPRARLK